MSKAKRAAWIAAGTVEENVRALLPAMIAEYYAAGRKAAQGGKVSAGLHRFRLKTKRFRYTLELFRETCGPAFGKRLDGLRAIQTALGDINDCVTARGLLSASARNAAGKFLDQREKKKLKEFQGYWKNEFDKAGAEASWVRYVGKMRVNGGAASQGVIENR